MGRYMGLPSVELFITIERSFYEHYEHDCQDYNVSIKVSGGVGSGEGYCYITLGINGAGEECWNFKLDFQRVG